MYISVLLTFNTSLSIIHVLCVILQFESKWKKVGEAVVKNAHAYAVFHCACLLMFL